MMREYIFKIIQKTNESKRANKIYDITIMSVALISLIPIMFRMNQLSPLMREVLEKVDIITVYILFFDYILRWMVYDKISKKKSPRAFILYPFTFFALVDFLSLLPSLGLVAASQAFRVLRVLRVFKVLHYSKSFVYVSNVFKREKEMLLSVLIISVAYIFISALIMFACEPDETFDHFFEALYWATTALTTVGYGDVYPVTELGRLISMASSLFGIAVIALPAGIITSGFMEELSKDKERKRKREEKMREELRKEIKEEIEEELEAVQHEQ